jgi:transposase
MPPTCGNNANRIRRSIAKSAGRRLEPGISGTYVWVSKKRLELYLREFEYRHNLRRQPVLMFELLLQAFPKVRVE